jgi:hypothetical protein
MSLQPFMGHSSMPGTTVGRKDASGFQRDGYDRETDPSRWGGFKAGGAFIEDVVQIAVA